MFYINRGIKPNSVMRHSSQFAWRVMAVLGTLLNEFGTAHTAYSVRVGATKKLSLYAIDTISDKYY